MAVDKRAVGAVVSLDPAGVGDSGVAVRLTPRMRVAEVPYWPEFTYQGHIMNTEFLDDLIAFLNKNVDAEQRVLLVTEDCAYRNYNVARHIGRAIGTLEVVLGFCGFAKPENTQYVKPSAWRKVLPAVVGLKREQLKAAAQAHVLAAYDEAVEADLAEAVCINDYVQTHKKAWWVK